MLEFHLDPESPLHKKELHEQKTFSCYCASWGQSELLSKSATDDDYEIIYELHKTYDKWCYYISDKF
tara:strand:+ start:273 stop:473 length:201 start_codon:yes stop_codon:yes gene_type:complete